MYPRLKIDVFERHKDIFERCVPMSWGAKILSNTFMMDYSLENIVIKVTCALCYIAIAFCSYLVWKEYLVREG